MLTPPIVRQPLQSAAKEAGTYVDGADSRTRRGSRIHDPSGAALGRVQNADRRLRAGLSALACGILLFLLWDVLVHGVQPVEEALESAARARAHGASSSASRPCSPAASSPVS